jgi:hypothetical protein
VRIASLALGLAACADPVARGDFEPPYLTITGTLTTSVATTDDVHVALIWFNTAPAVGVVQVAEDVRVDATFPAGFTIPITALPPPAALGNFAGLDPAPWIAAGVDPTLTWAIGVIAVYEDNNGNGRLDIEPPSQASPDRVIGWARGVGLFYLAQGRPAPASDVDILPTAPAFSLAYAERLDPAPGDCSGDDIGGHWDAPCAPLRTNERLLGASEPITIAITDDDNVAHYTCSSFWGAGEFPDWYSSVRDTEPSIAALCSGPGCDCDGYQCPLDLPPVGVPVTCNDDGTAYVYKDCADDADLCGTRFCHFGHGERDAGSPVPKKWPCP